jgi:hypothetical protein
MLKTFSSNNSKLINGSKSTDVSNKSYIGGMIDHVKHGKGMMSYTNGDTYDGYF